MKINKFFVFSAILILFGVLSSGSPLRTAQNRPSAAVVIKDVRIFDGDKIIPSGTVVIKDGKIAALGQGIAVPPGATVIDGHGKTLLPGLTDAHVHVWSSDQLKQALVFGVTTVVDMFMSVNLMQSIKKAQAEGQASDQAFLISSGSLATVAGGHGTEFGVAPPLISSPDQAREFVAARIAEGSDFIKIIHDDGSTYHMKWNTLTDAEVAALIDAAHKNGKKAVIHAATLKNCEDALRAGVDGLAHLYFEDAFDPDFGALAARQKAFVIPTLSILRTGSGTVDTESLIADPDLSPFLKPADKQGLQTGVLYTTGKSAYASAERALRQLKAASVPILAGTDTPNPSTAFGPSLHRELALLVAAGLTPLEALRAATSAPADMFHIAGRGRIRQGFAADLLLVEGDPASDIMMTRKIVEVWKDGVRVDRKAYAAEASAEREKAAQASSAPPPEYGESGMISDFEGDRIASAFGAGWVISTDTVYGGKSQAVMQLVKGGAAGSQGALQITGEIVAGAAFRWAGAMFSPGNTVMAPVNLAAKKGIGFWAKGDVRTYSVEIFSQARGFIPASKMFTAGPEWKEYSFPFADFQLDGGGIMAIFIGAYDEPGKFTLAIDNVRLK
jgi:imidazolonepropionase-like amidohydrolase